MRHGTRPSPPLVAALALAVLQSAGALTLAAAPAAGQAAPGASGRAPTVMERALESRTKGDADAPVVVFEIADFQCPYCARFATTVGREVAERYVETGRVQWVFVNMPLHNHPLAWHAAEAALCAGAVGNAFWAMHDRLFQEQQSWGRASDPLGRFAEYARALDLPMDDYRACVERDQVAPLILQDVGSAVSARVDGTPTFIIMRDQQVVDRMVGVHSLEDWSRVLDEALR